MRFCCFVTYTVDGFKHRAFGDKELLAELRGQERALDVPAALALRPDQPVFRRQTLLRSNQPPATSYSIYLGASEISQSRTGSFLGISVVFEEQIDPRSCKLASTLSTLLVALGSEVIKDKRFIREPDVGVVARFIERNTARLDEFDSARILQKTLHRPSEPWLFCTRDQNLAEQFEEICGRFSAGNDFLLLQGTAGDYKLVPGYQVSTWPPTQLPAPSPGSSPAPIVPTLGTATALSTKEKNASKAAALAQEGAYKFLIERMDNVGRRLTLLTYLIVLCTVCGLAAVGIAAWRLRGALLESGKIAAPHFSSITADIAAQTTAPSLSPVPVADRAPEVPVVPPGGSLALAKNNYITIEAERATVEAVRLKHCGIQKNAQFRLQVAEQNPDLNLDVLRKGTKIRIPAECS